MIELQTCIYYTKFVFIYKKLFDLVIKKKKKKK